MRPMLCCFEMAYNKIEFNDRDLGITGDPDRKSERPSSFNQARNGPRDMNPFVSMRGSRNVQTELDGMGFRDFQA